MDAEVAAFHKIKRAVVGALVDEQLPCGQVAGLEISGEQLPLLWLERIAQAVFRRGLDDGVDQPLDVLLGQGGGGGIHRLTKLSVLAPVHKHCLPLLTHRWGSLADAEAGKNDAQQIVRRELARDVAERVLRQAQLFGQQIQRRARLASSCATEASRCCCTTCKACTWRALAM